MMIKRLFCYSFFLSVFSLQSLSSKAQTDSFKDYPVYKGKDLGVNYSPSKTVFKVWAPKASEVTLRLYAAGNGGSATSTVSLTKAGQGVWQASVNRDIKNTYYTFQVRQDGKWLDESADLYAKAVGVNGRRGMVVNLAETNPAGWNTDKRKAVKNYTDIILYETHIRDLSISNNSGIKNKGKFLGYAESGTRGPNGITTGLDHLKELGITHVHLLPSFDFNTIDETKLEENNYNWGYDPLHYNVPEGSYSTNPYDGRVRIKEFKQMVNALHKKGIGVVMDVVYNHTSGFQTPFNQFAPGYYYRQRPDGTYSDASACGNETASERAMMRKFILESVAYWAREYHIDGFRFDLMGIHDIETMNLVKDTLGKIDPSIFVYGEGWTAGSSPLPEEQRAVKKNTLLLNQVAAFSDDLRDGLRGPFNNSKENGFVAGKTGLAESLKFGIVASTQHPQVKYDLVNYSKAPWAKEPFQTISYVSCHDDPTLFDRLAESNHGAPEEEIIKMDKLAQTVVMTSQGVAFLHSGAEMLRTKKGVHNSYKSPDSINEIDWSRKVKYKEVYDYYRGLVAMRKNHPAFRLPSADLIRKHLTFTETNDPLFVAYRLSGVKNDSWKQIVVLMNGDKKGKEFELPKGKWMLAGDGQVINEKGIRPVSGKITLPATTAYILFSN
jgi:pullulanase